MGSSRPIGSSRPTSERSTLCGWPTAERVAQQVAELVPDLSGVVFLAGERYREFLAEHFAGRGVTVSVPMAGLRIGEQLGWLGHHSPQHAG